METYTLPTTISFTRPEPLIKLLSIEKPQFILDWSKVARIDMAGLAILCCMYDHWGERKIKVISANIPAQFENYPVIKKFMTPPHLVTPELFDFQQSCKKLSGISNQIPMFFMEQLHSTCPIIKIKAELSFTCNLLLSELMQNSRDHSSGERYYAFFEVNGLNIYLGVLDMGVTVPAKLEQKYNFSNNIEAIEMALKEGITTRRQRAGGKGLFYLKEEIKACKGSLTFISRDAQIKMFTGAKTIQRRKLQTPLRGTWIFVTVPLLSK